jgi:hypothetical protein
MIENMCARLQPRESGGRRKTNQIEGRSPTREEPPHLSGERAQRHGTVRTDRRDREEEGAARVCGVGMCFGIDLLYWDVAV